MRVNVRRVILSPRFAQVFAILRTEGSWQEGVFIPGTPASIPVRGTITVASAKDLEMIPEGDRAGGAMSFYSPVELYITRAGESPGISDKIRWRGDTYKIIQVNPWIDYGYYHGIGVKMEADE